MNKIQRSMAPSRCTDNNLCALLNFEGSKIYHVRKMKNIKILSGLKTLKWKGASYKVHVSAVHRNEALLQSLAINMNCDLPKVKLTNGLQHLQTFDTLQIVKAPGSFDANDTSCRPLPRQIPQLAHEILNSPVSQETPEHHLSDETPNSPLIYETTDISLPDNTADKQLYCESPSTPMSSHLYKNFDEAYMAIAGVFTNDFSDLETNDCETMSDNFNILSVSSKNEKSTNSLSPLENSHQTSYNSFHRSATNYENNYGQTYFPSKEVDFNTGSGETLLDLDNCPVINGSMSYHSNTESDILMDPHSIKFTNNSTCSTSNSVQLPSTSYLVDHTGSGETLMDLDNCQVITGSISCYSNTESDILMDPHSIKATTNFTCSSSNSVQLPSTSYLVDHTGSGETLMDLDNCQVITGSISCHSNTESDILMDPHSIKATTNFTCSSSNSVQLPYTSYLVDHTGSGETLIDLDNCQVITGSISCHSNTESDIVMDPHSIKSTTNSTCSTSNSVQLPSTSYHVDLNLSTAKNAVKRKQHYCIYCGLLTVTLARHLIRKHCQEEEVKIAISHDIKSLNRQKCIEKIRKKGDFLYNQSSEQEIVTRNSNKPTQTTYLPCTFCSGYYSVKNLRHHIRKNCFQNRNSKRNLLGLSIVKGSYIHELASDNLKNMIYPSIRDPQIFRIITSDDIAVLYGNNLAGMYLTLSHHHSKMISSSLRLLAKIFLAMKNINCSIKEIKDIFCPTKYNTLVDAVKSMAGFDGTIFKIPTIVHQSCTLLKKIGNFVKCLKIKEADKKGTKEVEQFLFLLTTMQNSDMTKMATEMRTRHQRIKNEILPTTSEINKLIDLLEKEIDECYYLLSITFDKELWIKLSQLTLTYIMVFNRKRPGDVQRTEVVEYQTIASITNEDSLKLSDKEKVYASNFARYVARGKLNRSASILLSNKVRAAIDLLLTYRKNANICDRNKYLFADPSSNLTFFEANIALKKFCAQKGIQDGKFTATKLRKHLATSTATLPKDTQAVISDFMGHGQEIHNNIYKHRDAYIDITIMGKILTDASGFTKTPLHIARPRQNPLDDVVPEWVYNSDSSTPESENLSLDQKTRKTKKVNMPSRKNLSVIFEENSILETTTIPNDTKKLSPVACYSNSNGANRENSMVNTREHSPTAFSSSPPYIPSDSESSSSSISHKGNKGSHTPRLTTKIRTWTTPERKTLKDTFSDHLQNGQVPDQNEVQNKKVTTDLRNISRSILQVQSWIRAEIKRNKKGKNGWSTPQKVKCRLYFSEYYNKTAVSVYPSVQNMKKAINTVPEFQGKTVATLRSHLQHDFAYVNRSNN